MKMKLAGITAVAALSGCVTTPATGWREASRRRSVGTANCGVPK